MLGYSAAGGVVSLTWGEIKTWAFVPHGGTLRSGRERGRE